MTIFQSIFLGLVQGLTEFLPISSSGHLIIARKFLDIPIQNSLSFDIFLNTATLLAVIYCFWGDLKALLRDFLSQGLSSRSTNLIISLIVGTIPAAFIGFLYGDVIEATFRSTTNVAYALLIGSVIMVLADFIKPRGGISPAKGFIVGIFQALALIPGISRSGSSISGGVLVKLSREEAIKFSFLLLIPVSIGALLKIWLDGGVSTIGFGYAPIAGFLAALISGIWSVRFLVRYLSNNKFTAFVIYRVLLALIILFF